MRILTLTLSLLLVLGLAAGCGDEKKPETPDMPDKGAVEKPDTPAVPPTPDAPHPQAVVAKASCTSCHGMDKIEGAAMDVDGWTAQIDGCMGMAEDDVPAVPDTAALADWLAKTYGD